MTYNRNRSVIERMAGFLDVLSSSESSLNFATDRPDSLTYRLREAVSTTRYWQTEFPQYRPLPGRWRFEAHPGRVFARLVSEGRLPTEPPSITLPPPSEEPAEPKARKLSKETISYPDAKPAELTPRLTLDRVKTLEEIVGATIQNGQRTDEIYYPSAVLDVRELTLLFDWTSLNSWGIMWHEEEGITLTQKNVDPEILWRP